VLPGAAGLASEVRVLETRGIPQEPRRGAKPQAVLARHPSLYRRGIIVCCPAQPGLHLKSGYWRLGVFLKSPGGAPNDYAPGVSRGVPGHRPELLPLNVDDTWCAFATSGSNATLIAAATAAGTIPLATLARPARTAVDCTWPGPGDEQSASAASA
jgi:hypothetical protein